MTILLYSISDDDLKVSKTLGTATQTLNNVNLLTDNEELNNPYFDITLDASLLGVNYAYIEAWHRYYFVDISILTGNIMRFNLRVDRLMSFIAPNEANLTGYVERSTNHYNLNILDDQGVFTNDRDIRTQAVTYGGAVLPIENWKLIGLFNAGLCDSVQEVTP